MKIEIKNLNGEVLFSHECYGNTVKKTVENAIRMGVNLRGANLICADFSGANLICADFSGANLICADFSGADLIYANLRGANLSCADLRGANLSCAKLRGANLICADLKEANLREVDFSGANLRGANLRGANLRCANLRGANLSCANLRCANLRGADLSGANLRGATLQMSVPVIPDIHKKIYEALTKEGNALNMKKWHTCETTHCRAGWAVHLAGSAGKTLEDKVGSNVAGALIYMASDPNLEKIPDWFASDDEAMADIKKMAGVAQ